MQKLLQEILINSKGPLSKVIIDKVDSVTGGCIHQAWRLQLHNGQKLFAKTASRDDFPKLSFEANGLQSLKKFSENGLIEIPQPLLLTQSKDHSFLLLPWLNLGMGDQKILGRGLAKLHKSSTSQNLQKFGWDIDGFIGSGPQIAGWSKNWGECFVQLRLIPQLKIASKWGIMLSEWEQLITSLEKYLNNHQPKPSLVHGDLWVGNTSFQKDGKGIIFDPAVWWADREVDLAMTKLFGGFSDDFYDEYDKVWSLPSTAKERIDIYNLYHLLNHANIFGGSYKNQCISTLNALKNIILD